MRRKANLHAASELPDGPCLGIGAACDDLVVCIAVVRVIAKLQVCSLTTAENGTAATPEVRRETRAGNWISQCQSTQH